MLDILEDFLKSRAFTSERIDGSITGLKRQTAIDRFQKRNNAFIMLLSTRAGGIGINLTAADTCIIFDSDFNPQSDLQAQSRCHRIGQKKHVKVYRLLSRKTYEMQIFHMSSRKMGLDQAVLHGLEQGKAVGEAALSKEEIEKLLRKGAYEMFTEEKSGKSEAESKEFIEMDIDSILERRARTVVHENTGSMSGAAGGTFSKASFKVSFSASANSAVAGGGENDVAQDVDLEDPDFWKKTMGQANVEDESLVVETKRQRKEVKYRGLDEAGDKLQSDDSDFGSPASESEDEDTEYDDSDAETNAKQKKQRSSGSTGTEEVIIYHSAPGETTESLRGPVNGQVRSIVPANAQNVVPGATAPLMGATTAMANAMARQQELARLQEMARVNHMNHVAQQMERARQMAHERRVALERARAHQMTASQMAQRVAHGIGYETAYGTTSSHGTSYGQSVSHSASQGMSYGSSHGMTSHVPYRSSANSSYHTNTHQNLSQYHAAGNTNGAQFSAGAGRQVSFNETVVQIRTVTATQRAGSEMQHQWGRTVGGMRGDIREAPESRDMQRFSRTGN